MRRLRLRTANDWWRLFRVMGVFVIAALMPFRPLAPAPAHGPTTPPRSGASAGHSDGASGTGSEPVLPPGVAERFAPWGGTGPDERWSGCWLSGADASPEALRLDIRCPEGRQLRATLTRRVSGRAAPAPGGDCAEGTSVAPFLSCRMDGTIDDRLRPALLSSLRSILSTALAADPFVVVPSAVTTDRQRSFVREWWSGNADLIVGAWPLMAFLWLVATGYFGFASLGRRDWPVLASLVLALIAREALALHSIGEIEPQFVLQSVRNRHSAVQWLFSLFVGHLARDPFAFLMHVNGVLGALATIPLYLLVRQRTNSRMAGMLAAAFFAVHPLVARLAPTDNPYSLMLFAWFAGLALLSAPEPRPAAAVGWGLPAGHRGRLSS